SRASFGELREIARRTEVPIFSLGIGADFGLLNIFRPRGGLGGMGGGRGPRGPGGGWPGGGGRWPGGGGGRGGGPGGGGGGGERGAPLGQGRGQEGIIHGRLRARISRRAPVEDPR